MKRRNRSKQGFRRAVGRAFVLAPLTFLLVAGAGCPSLFEKSPEQRAPRVRQAEAGKDLAGVITAAGTQVNVYARLAGNADPAAGDTSITVTDVNGDFLTGDSAVATGDLLLIVQMAIQRPDEVVDLDTNDSPAYGSVSDYRSAGRYEFVGVESVSGNTITLACGLKNGYARDGKTQVIRVPQYTTLNVNNGASIVARPWDGTTGGVVAVHAQTAVTLSASGAIDVSGQGFRGGSTVGDDTSQAASTTGTGIQIYRSINRADGAEKGEGIAGYQAEYTTGRYGRGAAANAGGGGNSHNAGGGGGANAPRGTGWTGQGVMTGCTNTNPPTSAGAWRYDDGYVNNTCANSDGGGRGGYSYSSAAQNPLNVGPGQATWGGDARREVGGLGGRSVPSAVSGAQARLFMGGGGGAGDGNNSRAGRGGNGGGLVFLIAGGNVAGGGSILADGEDGLPAEVTTATANDAAGGGGGGGTIVVYATSIGAVTISAKGGHGGAHSGGLTANEVEGPGGGGGGGFVALTGATADTSIGAGGGLGGETNQTLMTSFPVDGATAGNAGVTTASAANFLYCGDTPATEIVNKPPRYTNAPNAVFTFDNTVSPVTYQCRFYAVGTTPLPAWSPCSGVDAGGDGFTVIGLPDGTYNLDVQSTDSHGNVESPPVTYTWTIDTHPPTTQFAVKPDSMTIFTTGVFVFEPSETPVTYACKLDGATDWAPCNPGDLSNPNYTTGSLGLGGHTLTVQATDAAGNIEVDPPTWAWDVIATGLDGGVPDAEMLDVERDDVERDDVERNDVERDDVERDDVERDDVERDDVERDDVERDDVERDDVPIIIRDAAITDLAVSPAADAEALDVEHDDVTADDLGPSVDLRVLDVEKEDTAAVVPEDTTPAVKEDTAVPVTEDVAPPPVEEDAATPPPPPPPPEELPANVKVLGGGFCAISPLRTASPAAFLLMAMAGLALLRRKRR
jgi:hypothetical protein